MKLWLKARARPPEVTRARHHSPSVQASCRDGGWILLAPRSSSGRVAGACSVVCILLKASATLLSSLGRWPQT